MSRPKTIINLRKFKHNIDYVKSLIGKSNLLPVIKANAYGHGYVQISKTLNKEGVSCVCVATLGELIEVFKLNLNFDILHLGKISSKNINLYFEKRIIATINSIDDIDLINSVTTKKNKMRCHLKIDTGMNRMGCKLQDYKIFVKKIKENSNIIFEGIYTHLACSGIKNANHNLNQINAFENIINYINDKDMKYHILNSGGIFNYPKYNFDYVRSGLALYGINPLGSININLKPVMKFVAPVVLIKSINAGDSIGYGCTYVANKKMKIGIVQCGYADGIPLDFSNKGLVYFQGQGFPIIGQVSMDLICVDFSLSNKIKLMEEVTIWGDVINDSRLEIISKKFNSIPYVFLTSLSHRVERLYVEE